MPFGINNPLPSSMKSECQKASKILASFVDPRQAFGPDKIIPPSILAHAKGLAIITVLKAGFVGSGRFGSGIVIARLADWRWSAPSAIATAGAGVGGQVGFEITDFVFILNDYAAVRTFSQQGSITLGGNVSIAAGPVGRNAEAAGAASLKSVAGVFAYSKTKGLFAGVSLEGSVLMERRDANQRLYGTRVTARQLLEGAIPPPPAAEPLMRILNSRFFGSMNAYGNDMYNDIPYNDQYSGVSRDGRNSADTFSTGNSRSSFGAIRHDPTGENYEYHDRPQRSSTWRDDIYDRQPDYSSSLRSPTSATAVDDYSFFDKPSRPAAAKPHFAPKPQPDPAKKNQARALFTFTADQAGDLGFKKGDIIEIVKRTDKESDWWTGKIGDREGIFPSNYVETI